MILGRKLEAIIGNRQAVLNGQNLPIGTDQKEKDLTIQKGKVVLKEVKTHTKDPRSEQRSQYDM